MKLWINIIEFYSIYNPRRINYILYENNYSFSYLNKSFLHLNHKISFHNIIHLQKKNMIDTQSNLVIFHHIVKITSDS